MFLPSSRGRDTSNMVGNSVGQLEALSVDVSDVMGKSDIGVGLYVAAVARPRSSCYITPKCIGINQSTTKKLPPLVHSLRKHHALRSATASPKLRDGGRTIDCSFD